jgi:small GTP-binding protein
MARRIARALVPVKVILVGDSGVGKTALIATYSRDGYEPDSITTVAPARSTATVQLQNGLEVTLHIWDTAGQETYLAISQNFYRDAHVALVCYSPSSPESISAWIERVHAIVPSCPILLVATKSDLLSSEEKVELCIAGLSLIQTHGARSHYVTSAKSGHMVQEVFYGAANAGSPHGCAEPPPTVDPAAARAGGCC